MSTLVTCMGESLIDFIPLHAPGQSENAFGTGESKPGDQAEVSPKDALIALTDILKLSDADLAWLLPGVSMEESLLHLCGLGPALVILTQGEKGVLARSSSSDTLQVPTFPVAVMDTVGAGDAFCAGVLAWVADEAITSGERGLALPEQGLRSALSFASAVAALNCTRVGANPPSRSEVEQFLQK